MTTAYPAAIDSYGTKVDNVSTVVATSINNTQEAVAALQSKVGVTNSGVVSSFDYLVGDFFTENTRQMYFYQNTPPVGWSVSALATNCVVGVKGGAGTWNITGGSSGGVWMNDDIVADTHSHMWLEYISTTTPFVYTKESDGTTNVAFTVHTTTQWYCAGIITPVGTYTNTDGDRNYVVSYDCYTNTESHSHSFDGDWRPLSAMGILAKYTGA